MIICGIDVGKKGGVALHSGATMSAVPMPKTIQDFHCMMKNFCFEARPENIHVFIEKGHSMPRQAGVFNYGHHCGALEGILIALCIPHSLISPAHWQREMFVGTNAKDPPKKRSLAACRRLFPSVSLVAPGCRVESDGMADALLICEYGRRKLGAA